MKVTGGEVENCTGTGWLWFRSSSPLGVSQQEEPADVEVLRSSSACSWGVGQEQRRPGRWTSTDNIRDTDRV